MTRSLQSPEGVPLSGLGGTRPAGLLLGPLLQYIGVTGRRLQAAVQLLQNLVPTLDATQRGQAHVLLDLKWSKLPTCCRECLDGEGQKKCGYGL